MAPPTAETGLQSTTARQRQAAALHAKLAKLSSAPTAKGPMFKLLAAGTVGVPGALNPLGHPDYLGGVVPNYANSPLPDIDASGNAVPGTGIRKFVEDLPGLGAAGANALGQFIPVAVPDQTTYPGADYYEISLVRYSEQLSPDLPPTELQGYVQDNTYDPNVRKPSYLGPMIVAQANRPVRVKFTNKLPTGAGGNLFLPVDETIMGAGVGPDGVNKYTQNRATLHLHGGHTVWISDGTPHQWITPMGENTPYPKGVSVYNVPDMPDPGSGSETFYYSNQQSARLLWYHDHSYGLTRLNVYAGEVAPYLVQDSVERELVNGNLSTPLKSRKIASNIKPGTIPADEVPLVIQDKTFVPDDAQLVLQDPTWDKPNWGGLGNLWFPHVYMPNQDPSANGDGTNPMGRWDYGAWFWPPMTNVVGWPTADGAPGTPNPSAVPEGFMDTPVINGAAYPVLKVGQKAYRFRILNGSNDRSWNLQLYYAKSNGQMWSSVASTTLLDGNAGEVPMVPAVSITPTYPATWPKDGRDGGVPDPAAAGPNFIQIGNESGFLPKPTELPNNPINYIYNRRNIVVLNVSNKTLMMGPAERADVIVDFSQVPSGSKLILYNDAPAPVPAFDPRYDYYTGDPDYTSTGGAPTTVLGYGPNIRTIMQIQVDSSRGTAPAFDKVALAKAIPMAYQLTQAPAIVAQKAYGASADTKVHIADISIPVQSTQVGVGPVSVPLQPKAIQELFDIYGRMNSILGVELPLTNFLTQTTIPLSYIDPPTEVLSNSVTGTPVGMTGDGTQVWKITHNGVDTHTIHFHLFDVQLINRVGWDGQISLPDANELGWKDSVRMNPLEDTIVALRPVAPTAPFKVADSVRPLDPTQPIGSTVGFTGVDPLTNAPVTVTNDMTNFGWEYVWHCHLLGHEENDMMRPIKFQVAPPTPINLAASRAILNGRPAGATLSWGLSAPTPVATTFRIQECADPNFNGVISEFSVPGTNLSYLDLPIRATAYYRIRSENDVSFSPWSASVGVTALPSNWPVGVNAIRATSAIPGQAVVSWALPGNANATSYRVEYSNTGPGGPWLAGPTVGPTATSSNVLRLRSLMTYWFRVIAINSAGSTASNASTAQIR